MNLRDISKPKTTETLNANLSKAFGQKINVDTFTLEQLQDARNKIRTKLSQFETNESYDAVLKDSSYQKNKLFLDVLNTAIAERGDVNEGAKPDYIDLDKDGDKKEPMKKAAKDAKKKKKKTDEAQGATEFGQAPVDQAGNPDQDKMIRNATKVFAQLKNDPDRLKAYIENPKFLAFMRSLPKDHPFAMAVGKKLNSLRGLGEMKIDKGKDIIENYFVHAAKLFEGEEDKAEIVMAAKDMVNRVTGWMEDTAEMQAESMLELGDAIRDEMGQVQSEQFIQTVKPGLESLYGALESTRAALTSGVAQLTGEEDPGQPMGDEMPAEEPAPEGDAPAPEGGDDFEAAEPAAGGEEEASREKRESIERSIRLGQILSSKKK